MKWQICPICNGHGIVPASFYDQPEGYGGYATSCSPEKCRTCLGSGKILEAPDLATGKEEQK